MNLVDDELRTSNSHVLSVRLQFLVERRSQTFSSEFQLSFENFDFLEEEKQSRKDRCDVQRFALVENRSISLLDKDYSIIQLCFSTELFLLHSFDKHNLTNKDRHKVVPLSGAPD